VGIVGEDEIHAISSLADHVAGAKVVHVNATRFGGGVAEILPKPFIMLCRVISNKKFQKRCFPTI
jgi:hypothetical protein